MIQVTHGRRQANWDRQVRTVSTCVPRNALTGVELHTINASGSVLTWLLTAVIHVGLTSQSCEAFRTDALKGCQLVYASTSIQAWLIDAALVNLILTINTCQRGKILRQYWHWWEGWPVLFNGLQMGIKNGLSWEQIYFIHVCLLKSPVYPSTHWQR